MENKFRQHDTRIGRDGPAGCPAPGDDFRQLAHQWHGLRLTVLPILRGEKHDLHFHTFLRFLVFDDLLGDIVPAQVLDAILPPARKEGIEGEVLKVFRQVTYDAAKLRLFEESLPHIAALVEMPNRRHRMKMLAFDGQLIALPK
jgi:hypothetical protein